MTIDTIRTVYGDVSGKLDQGLCASMQAAAGPRRRLLLSRLLVQNEGLTVQLTSQLCGRAVDARRSRGRAPGKGTVAGAEQLDWDDALQAGRDGMAKALEQFDPSKGKTVSAFAKWKIFYELQKAVARNHLAHVPDGKEDQRPAVDLVDTEALSRAAGDVGGGLVELEGITPAMLAEWQRTGDWPESLEEAHAMAAARLVVAVPARVHVSGAHVLAWFVRDCVQFVGSGRTTLAATTSALWDHCRKWKVAIPPTCSEVNAALRSGGGTQKSVRASALHRESVVHRGWHGVRLVTIRSRQVAKFTNENADSSGKSCRTEARAS